MKTLLAASAAVWGLGCGGHLTPASGPPLPALTQLSPPPGPFNDTLTVTLSTAVPSTLYATTDGSDPNQSATRVSGASPLQVNLTQTSTLRYFSRTLDGAVEPIGSAQYVRAGGKKGTLSGVVVVGDVAVNDAVDLFSDGAPQALGQLAQAGELPFVVANLASGTHQLYAMADRDHDGLFIPFLDYQSATSTFTLDLTDPFKASVENVRIYLGASQPGLGTIEGTITFPNAPAGQTLSVNVLDPSAFAQGANIQALLGQLQGGYRMFTQAGVSSYPYAITDLKPGTYAPVASLLSLGSGGLGLNYQAKPLQPIALAAGQVAHQDFNYGPVALTGTVTYTPAAPPTGLTYGIVAGRHVSLLEGTIEGMLMPTIFGQPDPTTGKLSANYGGMGLSANATYSLRVFTNLDSMNPPVDALTWSINPFAAQPPNATVPTATSNISQNIAAP